MVGRCCVRVDPAERYALPEGGRIGRMTDEGGGADTPPLSLYSWDIALCITDRKRRGNFISCTKNLCLFCHNATLTKPRRRRYNEDRRSSYRNQ